MEHWTFKRYQDSLKQKCFRSKRLVKFVENNNFYGLMVLLIYKPKLFRQWPDDLMKWATYRLIEIYDKTQEFFYPHFPTEWQYSKSKRLNKFIYMDR